jgi:hypothetical protein
MTAPSGNKRGRPFKSDVKALTPGNRNAVGRPKGDAAIINEYKARMLNSPKSSAVLEKIFDAALTDGHPGQTAAWKLIADRIVPVSTFDSMKNSNSTPTISINISSLTPTTVETVQEVYDISTEDELEDSN